MWGLARGWGLSRSRLQAGNGGPPRGHSMPPRAVSASPSVGGPGPGEQGLRKQALGRHSFPGEQGPSGCPSVASGPGRGSRGAHSGVPSARGWRGAAAAPDTLHSSPLPGVRHPERGAGMEPRGKHASPCPATRVTESALEHSPK